MSIPADTPDRSIRTTCRGRARRLLRPVAGLVTAAWLLGGCAFPFNSSPDDSRSDSLTPRERNDLYLREQQQEMRGRTNPSFDYLGPSR